METIPLLKQLSETPGLAGAEGPIREAVRSLWSPLVDELRQDGLGNLIALRHGSGPAPRPRLMLAAHMDEIGLRVSGIEKGFLRVTAVGGSDLRVLPGALVVVHGQRDLPGVIGARPPHVLPADERDKAIPWDELFVDLGLPEDQVRAQVRVGDPISFERELIELKNGLVAGKALDNRASTAALMLALEQLARMQHAWDIVAVATVQEEVGLYGAITSAYGVAPTLALAVDVTFADQSNYSDECTFAIGEGPAIAMGPNFHPHIVERLKKTADAIEIPYHIEPTPGRSGTDAWAIQVSREGVPTGLLSIPARYMHQPVEVVAARDVERTARLMAAFAAELEPAYRPAWEDEA